MNFIDSLKQRAKACRKTIVLPETEDVRTIEAAHKALAEGLADIVLIGDEADIKELAKANSFDISGASIVNPATDAKFDEYANLLVELRKKKGMTKEEAVALLKDAPLYYGCLMVKAGDADGMVAGAVNSTANVLRSALQVIKTAPGTKMVSAFFLMIVPDCTYGENGTFIFADSGLVQNPTAEELAEIASSSIDSFELLVGAEAKVGMLSHSTKGSAKHPDADKVIQATALAREKRPDKKIGGELQLDAAIVPGVAASKAPGEPAAGEANVLLFPDLDAGNIGYKLVQRLAKAEAYGPITQGLARPVNDLSRGCVADDIVGVIAITAVQAQSE
ncbi:MAG: phosphate acetyltransferase [Eubacteriales bacterium]|nr:phosphate acetyltransferase [Eubacteriales bacterium]